MIRSKRFLLWFVHFGKLKGSMLYFLFWVIACGLLTVLHSFVFQYINNKPFIEQLTENVGSLWGLLIIISYASWHFYKKALVDLKELSTLHQKGLLPEDVVRIEFVKDWEQKRKSGIIRFCLMQGGILSGSLLLFPLLLIGFWFAAGHQLLADFKGVTYIVGLCLVISYSIGVLVYLFRWHYNERKFRKLTNPLTFR